MSRCHHGSHCGCQRKVVYPVKNNVVHSHSVDTVEHIHPSHTTHVNHHLTRNVHVYPHSNSFANTNNSVNVYGGSFQVPNRPPFGGGPGFGPTVGPASNPGPGPGCGPGCGPRPFRPF